MGRLDDVARTLYALSAAEFTAERNAAAKDESDAESAKTIRGFRKPSAAASAVNTLVRSEPDVVAELLDVGAGLREAQETLDRDAVREFARRRQQVIASAEKRLTSIVPGLSPSTLREVEETLQAAMIDRAAAAAVQSGFLVRSLESSGLEPVDVSDAVALPVDVEDLPAPARLGSGGRPRSKSGGASGTSGTSGTSGASGAAASAPRETPAERRARERRHAAAVQRAERTLEELTVLAESLSAESERRAQLESERDRLSRQLASAESALTASREAERELRQRRKALERDARDARRDLAES
ncbi:hypothetical protein G3T36_04605 [Diaminobutyricibacter tongyongensis]|uniref:Uncharacterized protein n=1 Tax=Leifsonia tongyongensis TaxID=1268043 RepID=A0A6L9XV62_9MICO|nr:hypothetical protein [Diaminobutyricibacter tongyongensis]NEN05145.1 hypothetical protein [Diaminobutyricibacter tongyongensis]